MISEGVHMRLDAARKNQGIKDQKPRVLQIGGVTRDAHGDTDALRVRYGTETKWEWRKITQREYKLMMRALNSDD